MVKENCLRRLSFFEKDAKSFISNVGSGVHVSFDDRPAIQTHPLRLPEHDVRIDASAMAAGLRRWKPLINDDIEIPLCLQLIAQEGAEHTEPLSETTLPKLRACAISLSSRSSTHTAT